MTLTLVAPTVTAKQMAALSELPSSVPQGWLLAVHLFFNNLPAY